MISSHLITILIILFIGGLLAYRASFLKNKRLFNFSIHQILYQFVLPLIFAYLISAYSISLMSQPMVANPILPDKYLLSWIFLSCLISYGGISIHSVSKALFQAGLKSPKSEIGQLNQYLHLTFSHNIIFSGAIFLLVGLTLLELNHITNYSSSHLFWPFFRGGVIGIGIITAMFRYIRPNLEEDYPGHRWSDLQLVFALSWIAFIVVFSALEFTNVSVRDYQLLVPSMIGLAIVNIFHIALAIRHFRRRKKHQSA